jgi:hypothetical protein
MPEHIASRRCKGKARTMARRQTSAGMHKEAEPAFASMVRHTAPASAASAP